MANKVYVRGETAQTFKASAGTVAWTPTSDAKDNGTASALWTIAAADTTARVLLWEWTATTKWAAGPTVGDHLDLYLAAANNGGYDGGVSAADAAFTDEDGLVNMLYIGAVRCTNTTAEAEYVSGVVELFSNKYVLVSFNKSASVALSATAGDHVVTFTPKAMELQ